MSHKPTVFVGVVLAFGLSLAASAFPLSADRSTTTGVTRTIFASVVGKDGTPVTGLTVADFDVKEGGKAQVLTSVKPATMPLRVHLIVSDGGSGAFQLGALRLVQALAGQAQFAFTSVHVQPERVMDFTDNVDLIGAGIQKLGRRGTPQGGNQLMEAIKGAIEDLGAPGKHPVLIVLRLGNEDASTLSAKTVRESLRMSGATMYVVSRAGASKAAPTFAGGGSMTAAVAQREMDDTELADTARNLNAVLGDGSRESGGYDQETALTSAVPTLEQLAREIKGQYEISYSLPEGARPSDRVQVTTRRKDVTLRALQRVAN